MQIFKKNGMLVGLLLLFGIAGYLVGLKQNTNISKIPTSTQTTAIVESSSSTAESIACPIDMSVGEYAEYFRLGNETPISEKPVLVPNPLLVKQNYPLTERKKEILETIAGEDGKIEDSSLGVHDSGKFDVDGDGKEESLVTADIFMNHRPHIAMLVKNGNIIFEASGGSIWIESVYKNKGFLLSEEIDRPIGEYKNTRYVYKDGGFIPVWTQKVCYAQYKK